MYAVYEDFLLREPTTAEVTWWNAYLVSGSRTSMVTSVLNSTEFKDLWVIGASQYYLGGTDSQYETIKTNLQSTGDFVASEVALISGSEYFTQNGGSNTSFVSAVYDDVLLRPADTAGLNYWVGRLNAATATRASVANHFIRTTESATRRVAGLSGMSSCAATVLTDVSGIPSGSYCIVLDRLADAPGTTYWVGELGGTAQMPELWASLAGSAEYLTNAQSRF